MLCAAVCPCCIGQLHPPLSHCTRQCRNQQLVKAPAAPCAAAAALQGESQTAAAAHAAAVAAAA